MKSKEPWIPLSQLRHRVFLVNIKKRKKNKNKNRKMGKTLAPKWNIFFF